MTREKINEIIKTASYIRTAGSSEERKCAEYIISLCESLGISAKIEPFGINMHKEIAASLRIDEREIPCKPYFGTSSGEVSAPLYYLESLHELNLAKCKDKIVLVDVPFGRKLYNLLKENGAVGFITCSGNPNYTDDSLEARAIRFALDEPCSMTGVTIRTGDAFELVKNEAKKAVIKLDYTSFVGTSHNVTADLAGDSDETVLICAHYDSTSLSRGTYDNLSSCIALLYLAEYFSTHAHRRTIRFLWCGSEEIGLVGSRQYCRMHKDELAKTVMNINLDMLGSVMGSFTAFNCINEQATEYIEKIMKENSIPSSIRYDIRSSDSNSFVYNGVPAVSFARYASADTAPIHTVYDTPDKVSADRLLTDCGYIAAFAEHIANTQEALPSEISEKIKNEVATHIDIYAKLIV